MSEAVLPLFSTSASLKDGGIFTVEKAGAAAKAKHVKAPVSLCDLAKEEKLSKLHLVESNFVNFMMAHKNLKEVGCDLIFGLKVVVCDDLADKSEASFRNESKVIVFLAKDSGYQSLIKIYSKAAMDGFYYIPRLDWKTLKSMWSDDLILALPFYSSFLAKNTLTFAAITPDLPVAPIILREIDQRLPFDDLIDDAITKYTKQNPCEIQSVKSIYYKKRKDAKAWQVWRCILNRTTFDKPNLDGCASKEFAFEAWKELVTS